MNRLTRVLVAEDNEDDVFLLRQAFRKVAGAAQLHVVADGLEAVNWLKGRGEYADRALHPLPDALLLDLNMPRLNGLEVLQQIRGDSSLPRVMVHMLTTSTRPTDVQRSYALGANSYIIKPNRVDELVAFVAALHSWHSFVSNPVPSPLSAPLLQSSVAPLRDGVSPP